jgi:hypothetical protein
VQHSFEIGNKQTPRYALLLDMIQRRLFFLSTLLLGIVGSNALHFYLDANEKRCFIEELPTDTVVEGPSAASLFQNQSPTSRVQAITAL